MPLFISASNMRQSCAFPGYVHLCASDFKLGLKLNNEVNLLWTEVRIEPFFFFFFLAKVETFITKINITTANTIDVNINNHPKDVHST
jgi:hypothetical protein